MKGSYVLSLIIFSMLIAKTATAAEPDFYIVFSECKNVSAHLVLPENAFRILKGEPSVLACSRFSDKIACQVNFESGDKGIKGNVGEYKIILDAPPLLIFNLIVGTEFISVDTTKHTAVMSSLLIHQQFLGSKICHGAHLTSFEYKALQYKKQR